MFSPSNLATRASGAASRPSQGPWSPPHGLRRVEVIGLLTIGVEFLVPLDSLAPDVLVLQQEAASQGAPISFVLANGQIHDWVTFTPDGPQYWPQIDQELGA
jgi:hypothetical protein